MPGPTDWVSHVGDVPINAPIAAPLEFLSQKCTLRLVAAMSIVAFVRSVAKLALNLNTSVSDYGPALAAERELVRGLIATKRSERSKQNRPARLPDSPFAWHLLSCGCRAQQPTEDL
jgi:hypothetical protein